MFLTRRLFIFFVATAVVLSLGYLWAFFFVVGYVLAAVMVLAVCYNYIWIYAHKGKIGRT